MNHEVRRGPAWRKTYTNLICFNEVDKDGHFVAWEQPELFAAEVARRPDRCANLTRS